MICAGTPTWLVIVIVLACLGSVGLAGFVVYRLRLRSAMHQEIRAIMVRRQCCACCTHSGPGRPFRACYARSLAV